MLIQILVDHQMIEREWRCTCGWYRLGESIREHRAQRILVAGFHRPQEHMLRSDQHALDTHPEPE